MFTTSTSVFYQLLHFCQLLILLPYYYCLLLLIVRSAYQVRKILSIWCSYIVMLLFLGSSTCFFLPNLPSPLFVATFPILYVMKAAPVFLPNLPSPLFCRWWNCPSPYIIWNMSWWSRTCEELGIISSCPYITFSSLLCYDALMLQVHDQMMIDMFLRPLLLLLLNFLYIIVL